MVIILLDLFYVYDVFELYIDVEIMILYYDKYYVIYVVNVNVVFEKYFEIGEDLEVFLVDVF